MSDSMLRTSQLRKSEEETFAVTQRTIHQKKLKNSKLRSLSSITLDKFKMDIAQSLIATLLILLANSMKFTAKLIEEQARKLKKNLNLSSLVMPLWSL